VDRRLRVMAAAHSRIGRLREEVSRQEGGMSMTTDGVDNLTTAKDWGGSFGVHIRLGTGAGVPGTVGES